MMLETNATNYGRLRFESRLWDIDEAVPSGLGCHRCVDRELCGTLHLQNGLVDCGELCCGSPSTCTGRVCRQALKEFARRHMEIDGFCLRKIPRAPVLPVNSFPRIVPVVYHGNRRSGRFDVEAAAVQLSQLFDARRGTPRFSSREELLERFRLEEETRIIVCGIDQDHMVERWWGISTAGRQRVIENFKMLGADLMTIPNFSVSVNWPRTSDLYSIKRIALAWQESVAAGLPAALHPNGRTTHDFKRWTDFIGERPEVTHLAYEFTTGTGRGGRRDLHARQLVRLAQEVGRPLHLMVMGGKAVWPMLAEAFETLTVLETSVFMKTMHRQRAFARGNGGVGYESAPTPTGEGLDDLLDENFLCINSALSLFASRPVDGRA